MSAGDVPRTSASQAHQAAAAAAAAAPQEQRLPRHPTGHELNSSEEPTSNRITIPPSQYVFPPSSQQVPATNNPLQNNTMYPRHPVVAYQASYGAPRLPMTVAPQQAPMGYYGVPGYPPGAFPGGVMFQQMPVDPRSMGVPQYGGQWAPIQFSLNRMSTPLQGQDIAEAPKSVSRTKKRSSPSSTAVREMNSHNNATDSLHIQDQDGVSAPSKVKKARRPDSDEGNLNGEQRLMIVFDSFGRLTENPQKMGRKQGFIPDRVSGTFSMYGESWGFEVVHDHVAECEDGERRVCIRWTVSNKVSGATHSVVETPMDAMKRDIRGVSLCNKVFVQAMELRAREYEALVEREKASEAPNMLKVSNYRSRAQCLRPQRFSEGPLLFGLRHKCVQDNMRMN